MHLTFILERKGLLWRSTCVVSIWNTMSQEYFPISSTSLLQNITLLFWPLQDTDHTLLSKSYLKSPSIAPSGTQDLQPGWIPGLTLYSQSQSCVRSFTHLWPTSFEKKLDVYGGSGSRQAHLKSSEKTISDKLDSSLHVTTSSPPPRILHGTSFCGNC